MPFTPVPDHTFRPCAAGDADPPTASAPRTLAELPNGTRASVLFIRTAGSLEHDDVARRLQEIGFVEGEALRVIAHGGKDPIAVRVGGATFGLRQCEAERVVVAIDPSG